MSNCQNRDEERDNRKRKAEDRPPSSKSSNSSTSSAQLKRLSEPGAAGDYNRALYMIQCHPVMWTGLLHLKNEEVSVQMHYVSGSSALAKKVLLPYVENESASIKINKRVKLVPRELCGLKKKLSMEKEHCILVALPCGTDCEDQRLQACKLRINFIGYFNNKQAGGIVNVPYPNELGYTIHMFPACNFTRERLSISAPSLLHLFQDYTYLLIILTTLVTTADAKPGPGECDSDTPVPSA